jgi:Tol biopolymer transport system component
MDARGRHVRALNTSADWETNPLLSPSGRLIAFARYANNQISTWIMKSNGSDPRYLARGVPQSWAPDSSRLVVSRDRLTGSQGLDVVGLGGEVRPLTNLPSQWARWSPDSHKIAFFTETALKVINADGTGIRHIVGGGLPDWSPDGRWILFANGDLFKIRPDGTHRVRLTRGLAAYQSAWSPDGKRIVFTTAQTLSGSYEYKRIGVVRSDGTGLRLLTRVQRYAERRFGFQESPAWSPDGRRLVYLRVFIALCDQDCDDDIAVEVWGINPDGRNKRQLAPRGCYDSVTWAPNRTNQPRDYGACPSPYPQ